MPTLMKFYCLISNLQIEADLLLKKKTTKSYESTRYRINHIVRNICFSIFSFIHILGNVYTEDIWN